MKKILKPLVMAAALAIASPVSAFSLWWDGDGNGTADSSVVAPLDGITPFTIDLWASTENDGAGGLLSWGGIVEFNATAATATNSAIDGAKWFVAGKNDITPGSVDLVAGRTGTGLDGPQKLAAITFTGASPFTLSIMDQPGLFDDFVSANGTVYDPASASIDVNAVPNAVPIPASIILFGSGVVGLFGWMRKKVTA